MAGEVTHAPQVLAFGVSDNSSTDENIHSSEQGEDVPGNTHAIDGEAAAVAQAELPTTGNTPTTLSKTTKTRRWMHTMLPCAAGFILCLHVGIIGPTLLDLELITNADTSELSMVFMFRGALAIFGSLVWGPIYDRLNNHLLLAISLLACFILGGSMLWCTTLVEVIAVLSCIGIPSSSILMSVHLLCVNIWGEEAGPSLQLLNMICVSGYLVAPFLAIPFLAATNTVKKVDLDNNTVIPAAINLSGKAHDDDTFSQEARTMVYSTATVATNSTSLSSQTTAGFTENSPITTLVPYCFFLTSLLYLLMAIAVFIVWLVSPSRTFILKEPKDDKGSPGKVKSSVIPVGILFFFFNIFYAGIEIGYLGLLTTFAVKQLGWSKTNGSLVTGLLQGSNALVTAIAILVAKYIKPEVIVGVDIAIITIAILVMILLVNEFGLLLWIGTALVGVGYATIIPSSITWTNTFMKVTGKFNSAYWGGFYAGYTAIPVLTGYLFTHYSPMSFLYVMFACGIGMAILFPALYLFVRGHFSKVMK